MRRYLEHDTHLQTEAMSSPSIKKSPKMPSTNSVRYVNAATSVLSSESSLAHSHVERIPLSTKEHLSFTMCKSLQTNEASKVSMGTLDRQLDDESKALAMARRFSCSFVSLLFWVFVAPKKSFPHATAATNACGQINQISYQYCMVSI